MSTIYLASALITDENNCLLTVRKKTSTYYMMAGGKLEKDETPEQALLRELREELQITLTLADLSFLGQHTCEAVNETNTIVTAHIYHIQIHSSQPKASAEIAEIKWLTQTNYTTVKLARLIAEFSIPIWLKMNN